MFDIEHAHNAYDPKTVWDKHFDEFIVRHYHDGEFGSPEWFNKENIINELGFVDDDGVYRFNFCPCTEVGKERIHEVILSQWFFSRVWRSRQKGLPTRHDTKLEYVLTYSFNYLLLLKWICGLISPKRGRAWASVGLCFAGWHPPHTHGLVCGGLRIWRTPHLGIRIFSMCWPRGGVMR